MCQLLSVRVQMVMRSLVSPTEHEQRLRQSGQHQELSGEPSADKEDVDQVCRCGEPLQAAGALHRVGRPHLRGILRSGAWTTRRNAAVAFKAENRTASVKEEKALVDFDHFIT